MLELGDNILGGVLVRVQVDEATGRIRVYIPLINAPSQEPVLEVDPSITMAVLTSLVWTILGPIVNG